MLGEGWTQQPPQVVVARFECEPPSDLRKSNFFHFRVEMRWESGAPLDVVCARFLHFLHEEPEEGRPELRNGIKYSIAFKYPNGLTDCRDLYLTLVDANTREAIRYEGHDDNPKMQRVLLTHEAICTRCSLKKSCGNKNEAPSDPAIAGRGLLKFFLKCNQNCLKGAGNPRDTRRFALSVCMGGSLLALSRPIFVHNNSKHSRKRKMKDGARVSHLVGPSSEGQIVLVGENFRESDRLFVDDQPLINVAHRSERVIEAWLPPPSSPTCRVTLRSGEEYLEAGTLHNPPGPLACVSPGPPGWFDFVSPRWAVPGVSFTCGHLQLPILALVSGQAIKVALPQTLPPGFVTICVLYNGRAQFTFPYRILDRRERQPLEPPDAGYTCLYRRGTCPPFREWDRRNAALFVDDPADAPQSWGYGGYHDPCRGYSSSSSDAAQHSSSTP